MRSYDQCCECDCLYEGEHYGRAQERKRIAAMLGWEAFTTLMTAIQLEEMGQPYRDAQASAFAVHWASRQVGERA